MSKEMTPKEALEVIEYYDVNDMGRCVVDYCQDECDVVAKALTELEELKRDVKRYFELEDTHCNLDEIDEYTDLLIKLSKVGKGE